MNFCDRLIQARQNKQLTQDQLGELLKVHRFTVSKWETERSHPQKPTAYDDIAHALDVRVEWLRDGDGEPGHYAPSPIDRERRAANSRRLPERALPPNDAGAPDGMDWGLLASIVRLLEREPLLSQDALGRALGLAYTLVSRGREVLDERLVETIRLAVQ